jgi:hypothetical protein
MTEPADELPEIVRRIAEARQRRGSTYLGQSEGLDLDLGGRFAKVTRTTVIGTDPIARYPAQPANSPWREELIGLEPPLGIDIGAVEPVGEPHERSRDAAATMEQMNDRDRDRK